MSRRHVSEKRQIIPDPVFNDEHIAKFINIVMLDGKKSIAQKIVYGALAIIKKDHSDPCDIFHAAVNNVRPGIEIRSRRVGSSVYKIPVEVQDLRSINLAFKWIVASARKRSEKDMITRLSAELIDAFNKRGGAMKRREDVYRVADANKAFSHYRW